MGANMSNEEKSIICIFKKILEKRGVSYNEHTLRLLLFWLKNKGIAADAQTAFHVETWSQAGEVLWDAATAGANAATRLLTTWRLVINSFKQLEADRAAHAATTEALSAAGPAEAGSSSVSAPPQQTPPAAPLLDLPGSPTLPCSPENVQSMGTLRGSFGQEELLNSSYDPEHHWHKIQQQATEEGELIVIQALTCPVIICNQGPNDWEPLQWDLVKELRKTIMQHGLTSPFA